MELNKKKNHWSNFGKPQNGVFLQFLKIFMISFFWNQSKTKIHIAIDVSVQTLCLAKI